MRHYHNIEHPPRWPMAVAVVLHLLLIAWVIYAGKFLPSPQVELPDAVELWEGGKPPSATPQLVPVPSQPSRTRERIPQMDLSRAEDAEIRLKQTRERAERERERVEQQRPQAEQRQPAPQTRPEPTPRQATPPANKPAKPTKPQQAYDPSADLDLPGAGGNGQGRQGGGNAARNQQGGKTGSENGVSGGKGVNLDAYKREVSARVRSYASAPPGTEGSPRVTVSVRLGPSMQVLGVSVIKSSGDSAYDQAVVQGVRSVGQFPPRPDGASMDLFRNITLNISLPNR